MAVGKEEVLPASAVPLTPAGRLHGALQAPLCLELELSFAVLR